jgi:hypothetical protein
MWQPFLIHKIMAIIDDSYFWGELELGNLFKNQNGNLLTEAGNKSATELTMFINKYEKKYLIEMFGKTLANNMPSELIETIVDENAKTSPIANYVYYFIMQSKATVTTQAGVVKNTVVNTQIASVREKMMTAWNEMVQFNLSLHQDLYDTETLEYEVPLSYLNDIFENIDTDSNIFNYCLPI